MIIEGDQIGAFVPLCDMTNHSPNARVDYFSDIISDRFALMTRDGVAKGKQIYNNYGLRSNEKLLLNYGFIMSNNPTDSFYFKISFSSETSSSSIHEIDPISLDTIKKSILSFLQKQNTRIVNSYHPQSSNPLPSNHHVFSSIGIDHFLMRNYSLSFDRKGEVKEEINTNREVVGQPIIESFGFCLMDQTDFYFYDFSSLISNKKIIYKIYNNLSILLASKLFSICNSTHSSIEDDLTLIGNNSSQSHNINMSIEYRLDQKIILRNAIKQICSSYAQLATAHSSELCTTLSPVILSLEDKESRVYLQALDKWMDANSLLKNFHALEIPSSNAFKITWRSTKKLEIGESLISLPFQHVISIDHFFTTKFGKLVHSLHNQQSKNIKIEDWCPSVGLSDHVMLTLAVMEESSNSSSIWNLFFQCIATSLSNSPIIMCFQNQQIIQYLCGSTIQEVLVDTLEEFRNEWKQLISLLSSSITSEFTTFFTPENYVRSRVIVEKYSRKVHFSKASNNPAVYLQTMQSIIEDFSEESTTIVIPLAFLPRFGFFLVSSLKKF